MMQLKNNEPFLKKQKEKEENRRVISFKGV